SVFIEILLQARKPRRGGEEYLVLLGELFQMFECKAPGPPWWWNVTTPQDARGRSIQRYGQIRKAIGAAIISPDVWRCFVSGQRAKDSVVDRLLSLAVDQNDLVIDSRTLSAT